MQAHTRGLAVVMGTLNMCACIVHEFQDSPLTCSPTSSNKAGRGDRQRVFRGEHGLQHQPETAAATDTVTNTMEQRAA